MLHFLSSVDNRKRTIFSGQLVTAANPCVQSRGALQCLFVYTTTMFVNTMSCKLALGISLPGNNLIPDEPPRRKVSHHMSVCAKWPIIEGVTFFTNLTFGCSVGIGKKGRVQIEDQSCVSLP